LHAYAGIQLNITVLGPRFRGDERVCNAAGAGTMELPGSGYLFNLAMLAITFVGFTAIVVVLRQSAGGKLLPIDTVVARLFMVWGFTVTYAAMLPVLLAAYDLKPASVWQISNLVSGAFLLVVNASYPFLRRRATGEATPVHVQLHVAFALATGLVLVLNALEPFPRAVPAIYLSAITVYLVHASFAFVQHFGFMLENMTTTRGRRHRL
jgi:hypothetical protein